MGSAAGDGALALRKILVGGDLVAAVRLAVIERLVRLTQQVVDERAVDSIVADIRAGVIRAISFGYSVQRYEITRAQDRTDGINVDLYRAVRWTPQEISFVTVPADAGAGTVDFPGAAG